MVIFSVYFPRLFSAFISYAYFQRLFPEVIFRVYFPGLFSVFIFHVYFPCLFCISRGDSSCDSLSLNVLERGYHYWRNTVITRRDISIGEILLNISFWFYIKMSWKDIISQLENKLPNETKLSTTDLVNGLLEKGMIPEAIKHNTTLHEVMLREILLKTLEGIEVPGAPQDEEKIAMGIYLCRFVYRMNAKEMLMSQMGRRNAERVKDLERETG